MAAVTMSAASIAAPVALGRVAVMNAGQRTSFTGTALVSKAVMRQARSTSRRSVIRMDGRESAMASNVKSTEGAPMAGITTSAPVGQKDVPLAERIAYICQDCGYIYDQEQPFEEVPDTYKCPVCTAPKGRFIMQNTTVGDAQQLERGEYTADEKSES